MEEEIHPRIYFVLQLKFSSFATKLTSIAGQFGRVPDIEFQETFSKVEEIELTS
jgi:hypothetical protein